MNSCLWPYFRNIGKSLWTSISISYCISSGATMDAAGHSHQLWRIENPWMFGMATRAQGATTGWKGWDQVCVNGSGSLRDGTAGMASPTWKA